MNDNFKTWEEAVCWLRKQPDAQELVRSCYYDDPLAESSRRFYDSSEWLATRELILSAGKGKMLDIGAGRGIASFAFVKDGWEVTALEPDPSEIVGTGAINKLVMEQGLPITVVNKWGESLPFADQTFDLVYVRAVLHHARDLYTFCSEVARVLKPNGVFLAVREHVISKKEDLRKFLDVHPLHKLYGGENAFLLKEYKDALLSAGLVIVRTIKPLESPINYWPQDRISMCEEILARIRIVPAFFVNSVASLDTMSNFILMMASLVDNRPGRHYSFMSVKL
jgi:SAM-dependent methyltransferase